MNLRKDHYRPGARHLLGEGGPSLLELRRLRRSGQAGEPRGGWPRGRGPYRRRRLPRGWEVTPTISPYPSNGAWSAVRTFRRSWATSISVPLGWAGAGAPPPTSTHTLGCTPARPRRCRTRYACAVGRASPLASHTALWGCLCSPSERSGGHARQRGRPAIVGRCVPFVQRFDGLAGASRSAAGDGGVSHALTPHLQPGPLRPF